MAVHKTMITFRWVPFVRDWLPDENSMIVQKLNVIGELLIQPDIDEQMSILEISLVLGMLIRSQGHPQDATKLTQAIKTLVFEFKSRKPHPNGSDTMLSLGTSSSGFHGLTTMGF